MKKLIAVLIGTLIGGSLFSQWTPLSAEEYMGHFSGTDKPIFYKLDLNTIRSQLKNAQKMGEKVKRVEISLPTLDGKIEKFAVYSFPVIVKELADQYQLGSYLGLGIDDPSKYIRFSVAPNDFQSMTIKEGRSEFIEAKDRAKTYMWSNAKPKEGNGIKCGMRESPTRVKQLENIREQGKLFTNQSTDFSKNSDKKFRTLRLAISVTGEYTQYFGGTLAGALAGINATMTRVNGVLERDLAVHLNVQNFPELIYTDPNTYPYTEGGGNSIFNSPWHLELQNTFTTNIGDANYDIGHLFSATGNGGNAGCIGCICVNPTFSTPEGKGSTNPSGESFNLLATHEIAHQLGANHTFSHKIEGTMVNVEPASGSTIMGYPGTTGITTDIQLNRDGYFHYVSINQIQNNMIDKTCDIEIPIDNNPPIVLPFTEYTIPKGTAFILSASATDPEGDLLSYTWEQIDNADSPITETTGNNTTGALFRSLLPGTSSTRYFPALSSVLNGNLTVPSDWESVPYVPRSMNFTLTVRDNSAMADQQQTQSAEQTIFVGYLSST